MRKELLVLFCNRVSRTLIIVPPLLQIVAFGWAATLEVRNVDVAVLNQDNGRWSREIVRRIQGSPTFRSVSFLEGEAHIRPVMEQQRALFILVFDQEFSRRIERGEPATVQAILDGRRSNAAQIAAYYLERLLRPVALDTPLGQEARKAAAPDLDVRVRCWFNPNLEFQWFFLPNLIGMLSFMLGLVVTGLSVAREREVGTFDQLLVSPATATEIALAKLVPGCLGAGPRHHFPDHFRVWLWRAFYRLPGAAVPGHAGLCRGLRRYGADGFLPFGHATAGFSGGLYRGRALYSYFRRGYAHQQYARISAVRQPDQPHASLYRHCARGVSEGYYRAGRHDASGQDHSYQRRGCGRSCAYVQTANIEPCALFCAATAFVWP